MIEQIEKALEKYKAEKKEKQNLIFMLDGAIQALELLLKDKKDNG